MFMLSNAELVACRISRQLNRPLTHMMETGPALLAQYVESACLTKKSLESEVVGAQASSDGMFSDIGLSPCFQLLPQ
jgi:hypothetical protein